MFKKIPVWFQYILPQHLLSRIVAKLANAKNPKIKNRLIKLFIKIYKIDINEALETNINHYHCFNDFFTRLLKPNARPFNHDHPILISPADGKISQFGKINNNFLIQAKGHNYTIDNLLGSNFQINEWLNGEYVNIYLSPKDYHRVHAPIAGKLRSITYIPGKLFAVNPQTATTIPNLFTRNERAIFWFETRIGNVAIILVGAMLVAGIKTIWTGDMNPQKFNHWQFIDQNLICQKGQEIGQFKFGSTVIMLLPRNSLIWSENCQKNSLIKMGQQLGSLNPVLVSTAPDQDI